MTRAQIAYAAIGNPKWREVPVVAGIDWADATERSQQFASFGTRFVPDSRPDAARIPGKP